MHIFFSVGEPSGDQHAAHLMGELKKRHPHMRCSGFGGPLMAREGCEIQFQLTNLAVMGITAVIPHIWKFYSLVKQARTFFKQEKPDAVVLVDFPGFNWWIARAAKKAGIPVFYYLPPQIWAWGSWRLQRLKKLTDHVLCPLPFERDWYIERGLQVDYVGHPFFDEVAEKHLDTDFMLQRRGESEQIIGLLPGSRDKEVLNNFPEMLKVVKSLHQKHPEARFLTACYKQTHLEFCRQLMLQEGDQPPIQFFVDKTPEIIEIADCCLMVSGSVSLEMLARTTPACVIYKCSPAFYKLANLLIKLDSVTLPNLMTGRKLLPEIPIVGVDNHNLQIITNILDGWLSDRDLLTLSKKQLAEVRQSLDLTGASARVADIILQRTGPAYHSKAA